MITRRTILIGTGATIAAATCPEVGLVPQATPVLVDITLTMARGLRAKWISEYLKDEINRAIAKALETSGTAAEQIAAMSRAVEEAVGRAADFEIRVNGELAFVKLAEVS